MLGICGAPMGTTSLIVDSRRWMYTGSHLAVETAFTARGGTFQGGGVHNFLIEPKPAAVGPIGAMAAAKTKMKAVI
jgi:hypothetical protein